MNRKLREYFFGANWFTRQERLVICTVIGLLLVGWAVKWYRTGHPPAAPSESVKK